MHQMHQQQHASIVQLAIIHQQAVQHRFKLVYHVKMAHTLSLEGLLEYFSLIESLVHSVLLVLLVFTYNGFYLQFLGTFASSFASSSCSPCDPGTYSRATKASSNSTCQSCPAGLNVAISNQI